MAERIDKRAGFIDLQNKIFGVVLLEGRVSEGEVQAWTEINVEMTWITSRGQARHKDFVW